MSQKLGNGGSNLASPGKAFGETLGRGRYAERTAKQPKEAGKGRVQKARRSGYHKDSVDTAGHKWIEPAAPDRTNTRGY